jgi:hypothetical protein
MIACDTDIRLQELHMEYSGLVSRIAKREHKGAMTVTVDDLNQAIWLVLFQKVRFLTGFTKNGIADLATKIAREYLLKERIDYMHFMGNFIYTPEIVEQYLEDAVWANVEDVPDIDGRVDVTDEFNRLPLPQKQILFRKYGLGDALDATDTSGRDRKMADRAVVRITNNLNLKLHQLKIEDENV